MATGICAVRARKMRSVRVLVDALEPRQMLSASLVKAINSSTQSAQGGWGTQEITASGNYIYFRADDGTHGPELFAEANPATGAPGPAVMLADLDPSPAVIETGSYTGPTQLTDVNGTLYFVQNDGTHGNALWKTNGTPATTVMVMAGSNAYSPTGLTNVNGTLYFQSIDPATSSGAVFTSDGTTAGTKVATDLSAGYGVSGSIYTAAGTRYLFGNGHTYTTDGTAAGTTELLLPANANAGTGTSTVGTVLTPYLTVNGKGYIGTTYGLIQTDGTSAGTQLIFSGSVTAMVVNNGLLYFTTVTTGKVSLYKSDGTAAGTTLITQIASTSTTSYVINNNSLISLNGDVLFETDPAAGGYGGGELYRSDGTSAGTVGLATVPSPVEYNSKSIGITGNQAEFIGPGSTTTYNDLWTTNGTTATVLKDIVMIGGSGALTTTSTGKVFFSADDSLHGGEVCYTDGTSADTGLVYDVNQLPGSIVPQIGGVVNGKSIFISDDQVWASDGTTAGTTVIHSASTVGWNSMSNPTVNPAGTLGYFLQSSTYTGSPVTFSLWQTDGTAAGTVMINSNIAPSGIALSSPSSLVSVASGLYFRANITGGFAEFKANSGSTGSVQLVAGSNPNSFSFDLASGPVAMLGSKTFFEFSSQNTSTLYVTDGTAGGTTPLGSFADSTITIYGQSSLAAFNGYLYFTGQDSTHGIEVWRTDGTAAGTALFDDVLVGSNSGYPANYTVAGNTLYFSAFGSSGAELLKTDGTLAGTAALATVASSPSPPVKFTAFGNKLLFVGGSTYGPYVSDGTAAGTFQLPGNYVNTGFTVLGSQAFFSPNNGPLWATDGTSAGTALVSDSTLSQVVEITALPSGAVQFIANNGTGNQLWSYSPPPAWLVPGAGAAYTFSNSTLTVTSGTVSIVSDPSVSTSNLAIIETGSSNVQFQSTATIASLTLNNTASAIMTGSKTTLDTGSLSIGSTARFDLQTNSMVIDYTNSTPSPVSVITGYLDTGLASGGASGLVTTAITAQHINAISILDNADLTAQGRGVTTFGGLPVDATSLLLKYTYFGDANVDGKVDGSDYTRIDSGLLTSATGWYNGDFNYDGVINGSDYTLIDNAFNNQGARLASQIAVTRPVKLNTAVTLSDPADSDWLQRKTKTASYFFD